MAEERSRLSLLLAAAEEPERLALVVDGEPLTFGALAGPVREVLGWLEAQGVLGTVAPVALVAANRLGTVVMLYALMEAGVPVVLLHARLTAVERAEIVQDCQPVCVLEELDARTDCADARTDCADARPDCADARTASVDARPASADARPASADARIDCSGARTDCIDVRTDCSGARTDLRGCEFTFVGWSRWCLSKVKSVPARPPQDLPQDARPAVPQDARQDLIDDDRPLAILYTSGTTGRPKGAVLSRRALVAAASASAENLGWLDEDRWLLCMPLGHVGGLSVLTRCLLARRCVVLPQTARFDPAGLAQVVARDRVTLLSVVPTMLRRLLDLQTAWRPPLHLRVILLGGAAASATLLKDAAVLGVPVLTTYGLTEACSQVATQRYRPLGTPPALPADADPSVGPPVAGAEVRIIHRGASRSAMEDGEIQVRGPALFSGYHPLGSHPSPFLPGGWLPTGDLGYLDRRGELHVLARRTDLIVTGGENVYPAQVEMVLERCPHPVITAACVFGVEDQTWGQVVAAALVLDAPLMNAARLQALRDYIVANLAPHKRPRLVAQVAALSVTAAGKLDRAATAAAARPGLRSL